jgi:hypothetical protein
VNAPEVSRSADISYLITTQKINAVNIEIFAYFDYRLKIFDIANCITGNHTAENTRTLSF